MIARTDIETDLDCAQQISAQLLDARQARGLSQKEVAYQLMLSADQINCLETRSLKSFYNPQYYVLAAKKYAAFLGVALAQPPAPAVAPAPNRETQPEPQRPEQPRLRLGRPLLWSLAALLCVIFGVAYVARDGFHEHDVIPGPTPLALPVEPVVPPSSAPPPAAALPVTVPRVAAPVAAPALAEKPGQAEIQLRFSAPTWVSFYRRDGGHEQKVFGPDETLKLDAGSLTELIIGNAPATRATVGNNEISLQRFTNPDNKVARLVGQNLRELTARRP